MRRPLAVLLAAAAVLAACGGDDGGGAATTTPATSPPTVAALAPLEVRLLRSGAAPRSVLRHELEEGTSSSGDLRFDLTVEGVAEATIEGPNSIAISAVDDAGVATADYGLVGLDVTVSSADTPATDALDLTGEVTVAPDRSATAATIQTRSSGAIPGLDSVATSLDPRLASLLFPFPEAPVGVGAEWEIRGPLPFFGTTVELVALARLVGREGPRFEIGVALTMITPEGEGTNRIDARGFGELVGRGDQLVPVSGAVEASGGMVLVDRGPEPLPMALTLRITGR